MKNGETNDTEQSSTVSKPEGGAPSPSQQPARTEAALDLDEAAAAPGKADEPTGATSGIPVVGMGGSAGALQSFKAFFKAMPPDSGAAFVIIQHLAPAHKSLLAELLAQHTRMRVVEAQDNTPAEPNCVYIIPPNQYLGIRDGVLYLAKPVMEHGIRMPIDYFLRSLAEDRQERAVCILFSGAGADGAMGVRAVHGAGGLAMAQDQTAQFGELPRSAVATGLVDMILPPGQMPQALMDYLRQPYVRGGEPTDVLAAEDKPGGLNEILAIVLTQTNCDFRCYKKSTILRRIERRMGLRHISDMAQYSGLLGQDAEEVSQLHKDLLINVTAFFREAEAFEELRLKVIRPLIQSKPMNDSVRVWTPACSSGEEPYSVAMLLMEEITAARKNCPVHIFATDIDEEALQFARVGIYPANIAADVRAERLAKFFTRKEHGYEVSDSLRNSVVFATQNLIADPPFSKMDLVSCRNLLIYLDAETQAKLIPLFNFALNPSGYLFLGKSESVGGRHDLFDTISKRARLYRRLTPIKPIALDTPIAPGMKQAPPAAGPLAGKPPTVSYADTIRQVLLSHFSAGVVLVNPRGQILQFHGQTSKYLNMPTGEPILNLLDTAKEGLSLKLRLAMRQAMDAGKAVVIESVSLTPDQDSPFARVTVAPLARRGEQEPLLAVIFEDIPRPVTVGATPIQSGESETMVKQLEDELRVTQEDLQSSVAELQASNEELRVANEEVVSSNQEQEITVEFLRLVNEAKGTANLIHAAAAFFHERAGCEAVGIRLKEGDDYPYFEARGFPKEFVRLENSLCARDAAGQPIRDSAGYPIQECMCGNVIQGRFDPSKPFFTARGSFWSNGTTELLASATEADRQARTRNRCNGEGYESVALIALRMGAERLGLLQLNDKRKNRFTPEIIALWERLADYLAVALAKTRAEEALAKEKENLETRVKERTAELERTVNALQEEMAEHERAKAALKNMNATLEQHVAERTAELAALLGAVPTPVLIAHDPDCLHITGNPAADELLRNPCGAEASLTAPSEIRPRHFKAVKDGRELRDDELPAQRAARGDSVQNFEFELVFNDGMIRHVLGYGTPLRDEEGRPRGAVHVLIDITERKRIEAEIRRRAEELRIANEELATFNRIAVDRELRMIRLKQEVNELLVQAGQPPRYTLDFDRGPEPSSKPPETRA